MEDLKLPFKELDELLTQIVMLKDCPAWYELARTKAQLQKTYDLEWKAYQEERMIIIEKFGKKDDKGQFITELNKDNISEYVFEGDGVEPKKKLNDLWTELAKKEVATKYFRIKPENAEKMKTMNFAPNAISLVAEYLIQE